MELPPESTEQTDDLRRRRIERHKQNRLRELYQIVEDQEIQMKPADTVSNRRPSTLQGPHQVTKPIDQGESHNSSSSSEKPELQYLQRTSSAYAHYKTMVTKTLDADCQEQRPRTAMEDNTLAQQSQQALKQENRLSESRSNDPANTFQQEYDSRNELEDEIIARQYATPQSRFEAACLDIARRRQERERCSQEDQRHLMRNDLDAFETRQERWEAECREIARQRQERIDKEERERYAQEVMDAAEYRWVARDRQERVGNRERERHTESVSSGYQRQEATEPRKHLKVGQQAESFHKVIAAGQKEEHDDNVFPRGDGWHGWQHSLQTMDRSERREKAKLSNKPKTGHQKGDYYDDEDPRDRRERYSDPSTRPKGNFRKRD